MEFKKTIVNCVERYYVNGDETNKETYDLYFKLSNEFKIPNDIGFGECIVAIFPTSESDFIIKYDIPFKISKEKNNDNKVDISLPEIKENTEFKFETEYENDFVDEIPIGEYIIKQNHMNGFSIIEVLDLIKDGKINEALIKDKNGVKRWVFNTGVEVLEEEIDNQEIYAEQFYERFEIIEFDDMTVPSFDEYHSKNESTKLSVEQEKELAESSKLCPFNINDIKQRNESGGYYLYEIMELRKYCDYLIIEGEDGYQHEVYEEGIECDSSCVIYFEDIMQKYRVLEINDISLYKDDVVDESQNPYYQEAKFNEVAKKLIKADTYKIMAINPKNEQHWMKFNRGDFIYDSVIGGFNIEVFLNTVQPYLTWNWAYKVEV